MARAKGFQGIVGLKKATTWATPVVPASGDGVEVESLDVSGGLGLIPDNQITGTVFAKPSSSGNREVDVTLRTALRYEGLETAIALVMGTAGAPATVDTSAKQHVLKVKTDVDGIFSTLAWEYLKDTKVAELASVKWNRLKLSGREGERFMLELSGIANDWTDSSGSNTTTTIDSVTLPSAREYATFPQASFLMNDQSAGSLASAPIYVNEFELNVERPHERVFDTNLGAKTSEPKPSGFATFSGRIGFSVAQDGTGGNVLFLADQMAGTAKKMKLVLTSPTLAGAVTQYFQHVLWFPFAQLQPGARIGIPGPGSVSWSQDFNLFGASATPTGFTSGYTDPVVWEVFSTRAADALA